MAPFWLKLQLSVIYSGSSHLTARLRGDANSRATFYQTMRQNGVMSANDIRELEDMNLIPDEQGGSKFLVNGNFVDMANAGVWTQKYQAKGDDKSEQKNE
ncbi:hypothetical protein FACS189465_2400 [Clostridia bacterium]|nr:hypothetical protein FACS189465_2400 [Clostridia bacterium]